MYGAGAIAAWSRLFLPGSGADPTCPEPESAPGPRISGAEPPKNVAAWYKLQSGQFDIVYTTSRGFSRRFVLAYYSTVQYVIWKFGNLECWQFCIRIL